MYHQADKSALRHQNGTKIRVDGRGDVWADCHRTQLGRHFLMQDVDGLFGNMTFAHNTGEKLFLEYVPDSYKNREKAIRQFAVVALFDRKSSAAWAFSVRNRVSTALYLEMCRRFATGQPFPPRFFYIIGKDSPPWEMIELCIDTGQEVGQRTRIHTMENSNEWAKLWEAVGLSGLRDELRKFVDP
jgi:hypothetical protein